MDAKKTISAYSSQREHYNMTRHFCRVHIAINQMKNKIWN